MQIRKNKWFKPKDKVVVFGDIHAKHHNQKAIDLTIKACKGFGVNKAVLQGDTFNSGQISHYGYAQDESFREDNAFIKGLNKQLKNAGIQPTVAGLGNHDGAWFEEWAKTHPGFTHEDLLPDLYAEWDVLPCGYFAEFNKNLVFTHGDALNGSCAANPAASVLRNYPGLNIIFGHNHRLDMARVTRPTHKGPRTTIAASVGCLASFDYERSNRALRVNSQRHSLGFGVVSLHKDDLFEITLGSILETRKGLVCLLAGELYK